MKIQVDSEQCTGCGACISVCPVSAISIVEGLAVIDHSTCTLCQKCIKACPSKAISAIDLAVSTVPLEPQPNFGMEIVEAEPIFPQTKVSIVSVLANTGLRIIPRLANMLISTLEHNMEQPSKHRSALSRRSSKDLFQKNKRRHHRRMHNRRR